MSGGRQGEESSQVDHPDWSLHCLVPALAAQGQGRQEPIHAREELHAAERAALPWGRLVSTDPSQATLSLQPELNRDQS